MHIHELVNRYGITRQAVNDRINLLGIKRIERGAVSQQDVELLDKYHAHIKSGGTIENFPFAPEVVETEKLVHELNTEKEPNIEVALAVLGLLEKSILTHKNNKPITHVYDQLYSIASKGYAVSTSTIAELIGAKPNKDNIRFGSFWIKKGQYRVGREKSWHVYLVTQD